MSRPKQRTVRHGQGKHRTVDPSQETPGFKARVAKNRKNTKISKQSRKANRRKS